TLTTTDYTAGSGTTLSDYTVATSATGGVGQINARTLTASLVANPTVSKTYDGSNSATLTSTNYSLSNVVTGESFTVTKTSGTYADTHVANNGGTGTVSATLTTTDYTAGSGTTLSDYTVATSASGGVGQIN